MGGRAVQFQDARSTSAASLLGMSASWGIGAGQLPPEAGRATGVQIRLDNYSRFYVIDRDVHTSPGLGPEFGLPCFNGNSRVNTCVARRLSDGGCVPWDDVNSECFGRDRPPALGECSSRSCGRCSLVVPEACYGREFSSPVPTFLPLSGAAFDWDFPTNADWARVAYPLADDGGFHAVALVSQTGGGWGDGAVRSVRNYDVGAADVRLSWSEFADSLASSFRDQIAGGLTDCVSGLVPPPAPSFGLPIFHRIDRFDMAVEAGPLLSATSDFTDASGDMITVRAVESNLLATPSLEILPALALPVMAQVMRIPLAVQQDPSLGAPANARRIYVPTGGNFVVEGTEGNLSIAVDGISLRTENLGWRVADGLRNQLPTALATAINDRLRFVWRIPDDACFQTPAPTLPQSPSFAFCDTPSAPGEKRFDLGRTQCVTAIGNLSSLLSNLLTNFSPALVMSGPESGCYPINAGTVPAAILRDPQVVAQQQAGRGVCVLRLEPSRINILPEGLQIVVAEGETETVTIGGAPVTRPDPEFTFFDNVRRAAGAAGMGLSTGLLSSLSVRHADTRDVPANPSRLADTGTLSPSRVTASCAGTAPGTACAQGACSRPSGGTSAGSMGSQACDFIF